MNSVGVLNSILFFYVGLCGIFTVLLLSSAIDGGKSFLKYILCYVGDHTLVVLALHFLSFKVVSLIAISAKDLDMTFLSSFPTIYGLGGIWWLLYTVAGVLLPLAADAVFRLIRSRKHSW